MLHIIATQCYILLLHSVTEEPNVKDTVEKNFAMVRTYYTATKAFFLFENILCCNKKVVFARAYHTETSIFMATKTIFYMYFKYRSYNNKNHFFPTTYQTAKKTIILSKDIVDSDKKNFSF